MKLHLVPAKVSSNKCLVLIGGVGDPAEIFVPLVKQLVLAIPDYTICTFTFSQSTQGESILNVQSQELSKVLDQLLTAYGYTDLRLWCTSMGSFSTVNALLNPKFKNSIKQVIFFDPADYYVDDQTTSVDHEQTWSGYQDYLPDKPTISTQLQNLSKGTKVDVVHLIVRNYSASGYLEQEYQKRHIDNPSGTTRLNSLMVRSFYENTPIKNRNQYLEINNLPHAIFRDGKLEDNLNLITTHLKNTLI